jgi:hypothetical protein
MMTHTITRTHTPTGRKEILMGITAETGHEARMWFASAIATMLEEDPSGEFRMVNLEDFPGSPPDWYVGDGWYDSHNQLILTSGKQMPDTITLGEWIYRLEG